MTDLEAIKAKAEAARAPCAAYWLIVFVYLMIHLFPVTEFIGDAGVQSHRALADTMPADNWLPAPGVSEIPIIPVVASAIPASGYVCFVPVSIRHDNFSCVLGFEARGPPDAG